MYVQSLEIASHVLVAPAFDDVTLFSEAAVAGISILVRVWRDVEARRGSVSLEAGRGHPKRRRVDVRGVALGAR